MPGQNLIFHGTTGAAGAADGGSQPSAALYLGRFRASQVLHSLESTLTTSQTARSRHVLVDTAQIGAGTQAHRLKWVCMVTGPNALAAARVESFDTASGIFLLDRPLGPSDAASGDRYRLWSKGNVWPDVSAAEAAAGHTRYRAIAWRNTHGSSLANLRIYFRDLSAGAADFARMHQQSGGISAFMQRADDATDLYDSLGQRALLGGSDGFSGSGPWQTPFGYGTADTLVSSLATGSCLAIWLRRRIPAGTQFRRSVAMQLVVESTTAGSDPSPLVSACVLPFDVAADAAAPAGEIEPDRWVHVLGGTRLRGAVTRGQGPEANRVVRWALRPGDLGTIHTDDDPFAGGDRTDSDGVTAATYRAPSDSGAAGFDARARLVIGAGEEVGGPQPRLAIEASPDFGWDAAGDLTLPSLTESYDEDPSTGLWASHG